MKDGIQRLDSRYLNARVLGQPDRRAKVCLNLHGSPRRVVLPHEVLGARPCELVDRVLLELRRKLAALSFRQRKQFVHNVRNKLGYANLFKQRSVVRRLKDYCQGVESDWAETS
jgi:hypothetical protein